MSLVDQLAPIIPKRYRGHTYPWLLEAQIVCTFLFIHPRMVEVENVTGTHSTLLLMDQVPNKQQ